MNSDILNLSNLLLLTIGMMSGYMLWLMLRARTKQRGWIVVNILLLAVGVLSYLLIPAAAGYVITGVWAVLVLIPLVGTRLANHFIRSHQYHKGYFLASILQWFHPADGWRESPALFRALDLGSQGKFDEAVSILKEVQSSPSQLSRSATCQLYRMQGQWDELRRWIEDKFSLETLGQDSNLLYTYLLALGETGDLNRLLALFESQQKILRQAQLLDMSRMVCLAYSGRKTVLAALFSSSLTDIAEPIKQLWLATACLAAGLNEEGTERLMGLRSQNDRLLQRSVERRLAHPPVIAASILTAQSQAILDRIEREQDQEERFHDRPRVSHGKAYATYGLIALNIAVFILEEGAGGSENLQVLLRLGAFSQPAILRGEIWRMITSTFLHYGLTHLVFNVLALYFIGPFVEYWLGLRRYLFTYFAAGLGGAILTLMFSDPRQIVVGASGCVMGLIGASAAIHLRGWQAEKARVARKELFGIAVFIVIQTVLDILTPRISLTGHLGGLITGFIIGRVLTPASPFKATSNLQRHKSL